MLQIFHYTKITSSKLNEERAFQQQQDRFHPTGRDMSLIELYHLVMNYNDMTTNLNFTNISTISYEIRTR